jgi:hypothetical protein
MNIILELAERLENIARIQNTFAQVIINDNSDLIAGLVEGQLNDQQTGNNEPISPEYSSFYAAFKGFSTPNLKLEGDFHRSIFAVAQGEGVGIGATDEKTDLLINRYGQDILKLSDQNADFFNRDTLLPEMMERNQREL